MGITPTTMNWNRAEQVLFALAVAGIACWAIASIGYPMGYDQGMIASVGDVVVRGGMPYRDGFDLKGPITFYVFAAVQMLFGRVLWGIRLLDLSLLVLAAGCFYSILKRLSVSQALSRWLALCLVFAFASRSWFHVSQPDGWAAHLVVIAVYFSLRPSPSKLNWLAAGFLIGLSALIKPFYILFLPLPIVMGASGAAAAIIPLLLILCGAVLPLLGTVAWFGWNQALGDLVAVHFDFNLNAYAGNGSPGLGGIVENVALYFWNGGDRVPAGPFGVLLIPIAAGIFYAWRERRSVGFGLLLWFATALGCVVLQRKFYVYHWLITFPPILAIAALALARISAQAAARVLTPVAIGLFLAGVVIRPAWDTLCFFRYVAGIDSRQVYMERFKRFDFHAFAASEAASYIKSHTRADEKVVVYGVDSVVQFLSERASATRFVYALPLGVPNKAYRDPYRAEYVAALRQTPPRYIVLGSSQDEDDTRSKFPEFAELLAASYRADATFGRLELYRLNDDIGATEP
jgi:hypothetical protein